MIGSVRPFPAIMPARQPLDLTVRSFSDDRGWATSQARRGPRASWKGLIMKRLATAFAIATVLALAAQASSAQTLKAVQDRGQLVCGSNGVVGGFGAPDP